MSSARSVHALLWLGVVAGLALAVWNLVVPGEPEEPAAQGGPPAALVDGVEVTRQAYFTRLAALIREKRDGAPTRAHRRQILDQMVAEELLLARAKALGLPRKDPVTRRRLVAAMVEHITAEADRAGAVSQAELEQAYRANRGQFRSPSRYLVSRLYVRGAGAASEARARAAHQALVSGQAFEQVLSQYGDEPLVPLPEGPLTGNGLRRYLGPTAARAAMELEPGGMSAPVKGAEGFAIVLLRRQEAGAPRKLEQVKEAVEALVRRERRAELMERGIKDLRRGATVTVDDTLTDPATPIPGRYLKAATKSGLESDGK